MVFSSTVVELSDISYELWCKGGLGGTPITERSGVQRKESQE
jgi:hypothetical protein